MGGLRLKEALDFERFLSTGDFGVPLNSSAEDVLAFSGTVGLSARREDIGLTCEAFALFVYGVECLFEDGDLLTIQFEIDRTGPLAVQSVQIHEATTMTSFCRALDLAGIGWKSAVSAGGEPVVVSSGHVTCYFTADAPHAFVTAISQVS